MQPPAEHRLAAQERESVIRAPKGMGIIYGAALLAALRQSMPLAPLSFVPESDSDAAALQQGRIDLDVGAVRDRRPEVQTAPLYAQQIVGVAKAGHPLLGARVTLKRLCEHDHVAIARRRGARESIDDVLAAARAARRTALTVPSSYGALLTSARSGLVACGRSRAVAPPLGAEVFKLPVAVPPEAIVQAWHRRMDADLAHRLLRQCVGLLSIGGGAWAAEAGGKHGASGAGCLETLPVAPRRQCLSATSLSLQDFALTKKSLTSPLFEAGKHRAITMDAVVTCLHSRSGRREIDPQLKLGKLKY